MLKRTFRPGIISAAMANIGHMAGNIPLNDPTTPNLSAELEVPQMGHLKYAVHNLAFNPKNANERRSLNCYITIGRCANALQALMRQPLQGWAATKLMQVLPSAGSDMNAYYDRRSLRFFYYNHKGRNVYFGDSVDIIAHELGHAVLDAMRPDFWSVQALEIWSFHEAFSDIVAVFNMLNHDMIIKAVLEETGGDIGRSNHASRLAEEVGKLIRAVTDDPAYLEDALRNPATEKFRYVKPSSLPKDAPNDKLAAECHSFGRVFSAAWYEALSRCHSHEVSSGSDPEVALKKVRDACMSIVLKAVTASPRVPNYYEAVARCMVSVAADYGREYSLIFSNVFSEWDIVNTEAVGLLSNRSWGEVVRDLNRRDSVTKTKAGAIVSMKRSLSLKASDLPLISSLSLPSDLELDVPFDSYYEFDSSGNMVGEIAPNMDLVLNDAATCMSYVNEELGPDGMWELKDGRVQRRMVR